MFIVDWGNLLKMAVAYVIALPVGWERERDDRSAGLRTFPLVAVSTCGFLLVAQRAYPGDVAAHSRALQGLIAGIGFIGAGTIMKVQREIHGTATAASVLVTAIAGMAVAYGVYDLAILLGVLEFVTLRVFRPWIRIHEQEPPKNHGSA